MELTIILIIVVALLLAYLIFKFVKKLLFAVIGVSVLFSLIILSVFGLLYLDMKQLSEQDSVTLKFIYEDSSGNFLTGVQVDMEDGTFDFNDVSAVRIDTSFDPEDISRSDELIAVIVSYEALFNLLGTQELDLTESFSLEDYPVDEIKISRDELLFIIESEDSLGSFIDTLFNKLGVPQPLRFQYEDDIRAQIVLYLEENSLTIDSLLFVFALGTVLSDQMGLINVIEEYKDDQIQIYPNRLTFTLVRLLPTGLISRFLPED